KHLLNRSGRMQTTFMASSPDRAGNNRQITQAKLAEYLELKEVAERAEMLRKQILAALQQGAEVERGLLSARIQVQERRVFSRGALELILGRARVDELHEQIEPTQCRCLIIR